MNTIQLLWLYKYTLYNTLFCALGLRKLTIHIPERK